MFTKYYVQMYSDFSQVPEQKLRENAYFDALMACMKGFDTVVPEEGSAEAVAEFDSFNTKFVELCSPFIIATLLAVADSLEESSFAYDSGAPH